jgi:hypothetical protein
MKFKKIKKLHIIIITTFVFVLIGMYYFVNNIEEGLKGKKKKKHPAKKKKHPKKKQQGPKCICPTPPTMGTTMFNYLPSSVKILMGKYTPAFIKTPIKQMFT